MKALIYAGTETTEIRDWSEPELQDEDLLIDLAFCGICGSDMHAWHGHDSRRVPPMILGHEAVGTVMEGPRAGERVAINPLVACGTCQSCASGREHLCPTRTLLGMGRPGGFAERIAVAGDQCIPLQPSTLFETAALAEPLACVVHAIRLAPPDPNDRVTVLGGGAIGLLAGLAYRALGVRDVRIAEPNERRRDMLSLGGMQPYDPLASDPVESSADIVFDAVGSAATNAASSALVVPGGDIVLIGLQDKVSGFDTYRLTLQEITLHGSYCYRMTDFREALAMLEDGRINGTGWTEIRPLDGGPQAFRDIDTGAAPPKIILATS